MFKFDITLKMSILEKCSMPPTFSNLQQFASGFQENRIDISSHFVRYITTVYNISSGYMVNTDLSTLGAIFCLYY